MNRSNRYVPIAASLAAAAALLWALRSISA